MTDLAGFIEARLDEDECYARNAFGDHNDAGPNWREPWSGAVDLGGEDQVLTFDSQVSRFMVRNDPARVLRDVEAKRRLLAEIQRGCRLGGKATVYCPANAQCTCLLCVSVRLLAQPYTDHPDYDPAWAAE